MPNPNLTLVINSVAYLVLSALMIAGMYLQVVPQAVGLVILASILTHAGVSLPNTGANASISPPVVTAVPSQESASPPFPVQQGVK